MFAVSSQAHNQRPSPCAMSCHSFARQRIKKDTIEKITGAALSSQTLWLRTWIEGGLPALTEVRHRGRQSSIRQPDGEAVVTQFTGKPPATLAEARERVFLATGRRFSLAGVRNFLCDNLKMKRRKAKQIPPRCDGPVKQAQQDQWRGGTLEPLLDQAAEGRADVWFVDAAHFTMLTGLGYFWCFVICWVRSMSGRKRHSVLGALNAVTKKIITVTTDKTVNSDTMKELLLKMRACAEGAGSRLALILDNARYQHCKAVRELAAELDIELVFLPGYSPHFNLIERVWKFIRKTAINSRYFDNFDLWKQAIDNCVQDINDGKHRKEIDSLLTWNFQSFDGIDKIII